MQVWLKIFSFFFLGLSLSFQGLQVLGTEEIDIHLQQYAHCDETHHDTLAEDKHFHTHKHSENGEEHEHNHDHKNFSQGNIDILNKVSFHLLNESYEEGGQHFAYHSMGSTEHIYPIFRPPIV
jgi:ABC-type nickel/cobalt efflux system permease component RcnA